MKKGESSLLNSYCSVCGKKVDIVPAINGETVVVDSEYTDFAIDFASGFVRVKTGRKVHKCNLTERENHKDE
jgi:hypothetical protein